MTEVKPTQGFQQVSATAEPDPFAPSVPVVVTAEELAMAQRSRLFSAPCGRQTPPRREKVGTFPR